MADPRLAQVPNGAALESRTLHERGRTAVDHHEGFSSSRSDTAETAADSFCSQFECQMMKRRSGTRTQSKLAPRFVTIRVPMDDLLSGK